MPFSSQREAKQFLADKIIAEADREGLPLSNIERRMLLFSVDEPETMEGFPENVSMDVDEAYEKKITALLKAAYARDKDIPGEGQNYKDAYDKLAEGDHYISVMAGSVLDVTKPRDWLIYVAIGLGIVGIVIAFAVWSSAH